MLLAIDPGPEQSGFVSIDEETGEVARAHPLDCDGFGHAPNKELLDTLYLLRDGMAPIHIGCEMVTCYGMPVGADVFKTCVWIGRFLEAWGEKTFALVGRREIAMHLCGSRGANKMAVNAHIADWYLHRFPPGGGKNRLKGVKKQPGPLYGFSNHIFDALAVGIYLLENPRVLKG